MIERDVNATKATRDLVIKGLNVDVTGENLSGFLLTKGVEIMQCTLLTTFSDAKSLAYKVTIDMDKQNVVMDPSIWPENVRIQPYKQKRRNSTSPLKKSSGNKRNVKVTKDIDEKYKRSGVDNLGGLSVRFENAEVRNLQYAHFLSSSH